LAAGVEVDVGLVEAAALLHDIAKAACLHGGDHAQEGAGLLRTLGYPEVASLVARHVELGTWRPAGQVTEAEILNYSDKRVRHEEVVSLRERFEDLVERYGGRSPGAEGRIRQNWRITEELEAKIFRRLPFGPEGVGV
jgi:HD superfamily phosphodiesterase